MLDVEFQAMIERVDAPLPYEPTAEELHYLFWVQPQEEAAARPRQNIVSTPFPRVDVEQLRRIGMATHTATREAIARDVLFGVETIRPVPQVRIVDRATARENPDASIELPKTGYRVQLQSGGQWFDCEGGPARDWWGASDLRDRLQRAQPHLVLRILPPEAK